MAKAEVTVDINTDPLIRNLAIARVLFAMSGVVQELVCQHNDYHAGTRPPVELEDLSASLDALEEALGIKGAIDALERTRPEGEDINWRDQLFEQIKNLTDSQDPYELEGKKLETLGEPES